MKQLLIATALLFASVPQLLGNIDPAARELLLTAMRQSSLYSDQANPLQLDVDFVAQVNTPEQGHLTLKWAAKDRWWRKVVIGDFHSAAHSLRFSEARAGANRSVIPFAELRRTCISLLSP